MVHQALMCQCLFKMLLSEWAYFVIKEKKNNLVCMKQQQNPKARNFFKLVVLCSAYNWLYQVMLHKAIKFKSYFWTLAASGLLPTSSESFTVIHRKKSVAGVQLLAHFCFRIDGILSFSKEALVKCCYSPLCIVNNNRIEI